MYVCVRVWVSRQQSRGEGDRKVELSFRLCCVLQCVAVCCSVVQSGAVCYSVFQCAAVCCSVLKCVAAVC